MSFDAVFEQPEIITDLGDLDVEVATYAASATRTGSGWVLSVRGLPDGEVVDVEGRTWREAEDAAQARVAGGGVVVSVAPGDPAAEAAVRALTGARLARAAAEQAERDAARDAARLLVGQGWPVDDVAAVLRLTPERVSKLAEAAADRPVPGHAAV